MLTEPQTILIVEDNPEDFETTTRAFKQAGVANRIVHCENGDDALDCLHGRGQFANADPEARPGIILLDLNLPGIDGRDVLREIKSCPHLKSIPVVVLTTSSDERDVDACYRDGANSYIQKPVDLQRFRQAIQRLKGFWFEIAILPPRTSVAL